MNPTNDVLQGAVGYFWPQEDHRAHLGDDEDFQGYIHLNTNGYVEVKVLEPDPGAAFFDRADRPKAIFGMTEASGILVPEVLGKSGSRHIGGSRASVRKFTAKALVSGVHLDAVHGSQMTEVCAYFPEGLLWSGQTALETDRELHSDGRFRSVTWRLTADGELAGGKIGAIEVVLAPHWETKADPDTQGSRVVHTALEVRLSSRRPRPLSDFITHMVRVQDLLSMAHDEFVLATGGRARPAGYAHRSGLPHLWHQDLMQRPLHEQAPQKQASVTLFSLSDIGGAAGVRRWLQLCAQFPDAASAVSSVYRRSGLPDGLRMQEIGSAIEDYVAAMRRDRSVKWAQKSASTKSYAASLARRVGDPFEELVGDIDLWAKRFLQAYNGTKHNNGYQRDPEELYLLAWSGDVLLAVALLDRVAGTKTPSRTMLRHHAIQRGGKALRELIGT